MTATKTETRRLVYVLNPASGRGRYLPAARAAAEAAGADAIHLTERAGECPEFIAEACLADPDTHFVVYGGDGTAGEAVNGILRAGAGERARLTMMPAGSGNDFLRGIAAYAVPEGQDALPLDVLCVNGRYVLNMLNIGFDCEVVAQSERLRRRRLMTNSLSYIFGVAKVLAKKKPFTTTVTLGGCRASDGGEETVTDELLLCAAANLPYCGGGFMAAPAADPTDGYMDVLIARNMTRRQFVGLVGGYRGGTHVNAETAAVYPQYAQHIVYRQCRSMTLSGVSQICLDGEVIPAGGVRVEVVPAAIRYVPAV